MDSDHLYSGTLLDLKLSQGTNRRVYNGNLHTGTQYMTQTEK